MNWSDEVDRYLRLGAASGETDRANRRALDRWRLMPRVLRDVSVVDTSKDFFGRAAKAPIVIAPMAAQRLVHPDGELAVAGGAAAVGLPLILSLSSTTPIEEIAGVADLDVWFQIYPFEDPSATRRVLDRALQAGVRAIVVTVDMPPLERAATPGRSIRLPPGVAYAHHPESPEMSTTFGWDDLAELVRYVEVPTVVKGVMHAADACRAIEIGAAGVVISNHGGRVHDGLVAAIDALATLSSESRRSEFPALSSTGELMVDGAIATGTDVVRALALGADAVLVGRPVLWALASGGERGVRDLLQQYCSELATAMAIIGESETDSITRHHVVGEPWVAVDQ